MRGEFILPDLKYSTVFPSSHTPTPATTILLYESMNWIHNISGIYHIYRFVTGLFSLAYCPQRSSMLSYVAEFPFFFVRLSNVQLHVYFILPPGL